VGRVQESCTFILRRIIHFPNPFQNGAAEDEWLMGFIGRHPGITMRSPEPTSIARDGRFNRPQATHFYSLLSDLQPLAIAVYGPLKLF
jgi:hypothetical protein